MENLNEEIKEINQENDIFGTYAKAKSICEFLELDTNKEILENNNLIAIYGTWGSGKSCLMKTIYNNLNKEKFNVTWFDTWKYERDENLPYSLFKFIGKDDFFNKMKETCSSVLNTAYGIFKSLTKGVELNLGPVNIKPGDILDEAEKQGDRIIEESYESECLWEKVQEFENEFRKIEFADNKRMIVFLDDLDRCESENIITLISAIKLLLSINKNIIFIIGVDKNAVTLALNNRYNNDCNKADEYLEKIFPITFELINNMQIQNSLKYISEITGLSEEDSELILSFFENIHFTNARHIKKVLRKYYFIKEYLKDKGIGVDDNRNVLLVIYIILVNIYYNDEYKYMIREDKEKMYDNLVIFCYDSNNIKRNFRYPHYKNHCYIKYTDGKKYDINKLLVRFSSYKRIKDEIKCMIYHTGNAEYECDDWLNIFENNVCSEFIKFIINNSYSFENMVKNNEFDDEKMIGILNIINDII